MISLLLLWPLYIIGIQYKRGGIWSMVLPITFVTFVLDVILNYTELALVTWDFPKKEEHTFSQRLLRLNRDNKWRGWVGRFISRKMLDPFDPRGYHIRREV